MPNKEPERLSKGKEFHKEVQTFYEAMTLDGTSNREVSLAFEKRLKVDPKGRMDILINDIGDDVAIAEIKNTDFDRIKRGNVKKNLYSHQRQIWKYIDQYVDSSISVYPAIIYPRRPKNENLIELVESYMAERAIQVIWFEDIKDEKPDGTR